MDSLTISQLQPVKNYEKKKVHIKIIFNVESKSLPKFDIRFHLVIYYIGVVRSKAPVKS